jgi:hypothetical protein
MSEAAQNRVLMFIERNFKSSEGYKESDDLKFADGFSEEYQVFSAYTLNLKRL